MNDPGWRPSVTRVTWKDEDEIDGEPVGPVSVYPGDGGGPQQPPGWLTLSEARAIAAEHNVELEEV